MKRITQILSLIALFNLQYPSIIAQSLNPKVLSSCGVYSQGGGSSLSWTAGETFTNTLYSVNNKLTQGFQQPMIMVSIVNLKAYIEGFYLGNGKMNSSIDSIVLPNIADTIILQLADSAPPYSILFSDKEILQTNGTAQFRFNRTAMDSRYYLVLRHRNSIETWSSITVKLTDNMIYDFTDAQNKAFGNNLKDLNDGNFAIYSGDIADAVTGIVGLQDGVIESSDYSEMENAVFWIYTGYIPQDITGDNVAESTDYSIMENNVWSIIIAIRP